MMSVNGGATTGATDFKIPGGILSGPVALPLCKEAINSRQTSCDLNTLNDEMICTCYESEQQRDSRICNDCQDPVDGQLVAAH